MAIIRGSVEKTITYIQAEAWSIYRIQAQQNGWAAVPSFI